MELATDVSLFFAFCVGAMATGIPAAFWLLRQKSNDERVAELEKKLQELKSEVDRMIRHVEDAQLSNIEDAVKKVKESIIPLERAELTLRVLRTTLRAIRF